MIKKIFAHFPIAEVFCRKIYRFIPKDAAIIRRIRNKYLFNKKKNQLEQLSLDKLMNDIKSLGVKKGDILIVHSSADGLEEVQAEPKDILLRLMELLGNEGTLVLPTFPYYKNIDDPNSILKYDPYKTIAWTGILPNVFLTLHGTVRSCFPNNSLAANGKYAEEMFQHEMEDTASHGPHSAWNFCAEHHAKVLFLGVVPNHALSEIHLGEGVLDQAWPIKNWYYEQTYRMKICGEWKEEKIRVRRRFWVRYITEEYCTAQLAKSGILKLGSGLCKGYVQDVFQLKQWLLDRIDKGNLVFYKIPRKYWNS